MFYSNAEVRRLEQIKPTHPGLEKFHGLRPGGQIANRRNFMEKEMQG